VSVRSRLLVGGGGGRLCGGRKSGCLVKRQVARSTKIRESRCALSDNRIVCADRAKQSPYCWKAESM
jgi:hypothetical protein